jgi:ABC-2 family transporter protein
MIRFAWIRFRTQALVGAGVLAIFGAALLVTGLWLAHSYHASASVCGQHSDCADLFNVWPSNGYLTADNILGAACLAVPGLIGMFWGAPLVAREFETGTFRLAWTQGVTRVQWLAAKLAIAGAAAIAAAELFTLMVNWWSSPIHQANPGYNPFMSSSYHTGIAPAGYTALAFAVGVTAGLLIRRTLPAMAVTLAIYTAVIIVFPIWVRPHLIPPVRTTSTLSQAAIAAMPGVGAFNGSLSLASGSPAAPPGAWVISASQLTAPDGRAASDEPAGPCENQAGSQACNDYIERLHLRQTVTYQPASRYWAFQWLETGIYFTVAFALSGFSLWWVKRNRSAELDIRRPRTRPRTPALVGSP